MVTKAERQAVAAGQDGPGLGPSECGRSVGCEDFRSRQQTCGVLRGHVGRVGGGRVRQFGVIDDGFSKGPGF